MLSQTCEYALRAVACLAQRPGDYVTASDLASATSVPSDYLSKVLQQLAGARVVRGRRGVGGGYRLARNPEEISLYEIIDAMGVIQRLRSCPTHGDESRGLCPLHDTVDEAIRAAENVFRARTLASILEDEESKGPLCVAHDVDRQPGLGRSVTNGAGDARPAPNPARALQSPEVHASTVSTVSSQQFKPNGHLKARPRRLGVE